MTRRRKIIARALRRHALALALAAAFAGAAPAATCLPRAQMLDLLSTRYAEVPVARGLSGDGSALAELHVSPAGTWTLTATTPAGLTCLIAAGQAWQAADAPKPQL